jgi:nucleoside-diphosphate-sugar epimerase
LVHARDIAAAFLTALEAPVDKVHCRAYNVGTESNNVTVAEIAQAVVDVVPGAKLLITGESGADPRSYQVDFSAFRDALGFEAAWSIPDGAAELYREYTSAGLTADDFAKKFTRLPHLESLRAGGVLDESMRRITTDA